MISIRHLLRYDDENHDYTISGDKPISVPGVSKLMRSTGIIPETTYKLPEVYLERGTYIHSLTEDFDQGKYYPELVEVEHPEWMPFINAYRDFNLQNRVEVLESEVGIWSDAYLFAGRKDRTLVVNGTRYIVDIKTGEPARWHIVQLACYALGSVEDESNAADLYLKKDGTYKFHPWRQEQFQEAKKLVAYMSACHWFSRPTDYKKLRQMQGEQA